MSYPLTVNKIVKVLLLATLTVVLFSFSYSYNISGFITNDEDGEPVPFATAAILDIKSNEILKGTSADIDGYYILTNVDFNNEYKLNISIIGYGLYEELIKRRISLENLANNGEIIDGKKVEDLVWDKDILNLQVTSKQDFDLVEEYLKSDEMERLFNQNKNFRVVVSEINGALKII